jgi:hypothetical protein
VFSDSASNATVDNFKARLVTSADNTELAVLLQVDSVPDVPKDTDYVFFGISESVGATTDGKAVGVRIKLKAFGLNPGIHQPVPRSAVTFFTYSGSTWTGVGAVPTDPNVNVIPAWIVTRQNGDPLISEWIDVRPPTAVEADRLAADRQAGVDGAKLSIALRIKLNTSALNLVAKPAKVSYGGMIEIAGAGTVNFFTPKLSGCPGGCATGGNSGLEVNNPFLAKTSQWTPVDSIGADCSGINFESTDISTPLVCGPNNSISNCLYVNEGRENTLNFTPDMTTWWGSRTTIAADWIRATFKLSNWGSVADPAQWKMIKEFRNASISNPLAPVLANFPMSTSCPNTLPVGVPAGTKNVCGKTDFNFKDQVDATNQYFHQCMLVELRATPEGTVGGVRFQKAADYINTAFSEASVVDRFAQINIKGAVTPAAGQKRDVYLHVDARNMPSHTDTAVPLLDVAGLKSLRGQIDEGYSVPGTTCPFYQQCYVQQGTAGKCANPFVQTDSEFSCETVTINGKPYCKPAANAPACSRPAGGGFNRTTSSHTGAQKLIAEFPTVMVYPYMDSGKTQVVGGVSKKRMVPMPSFGIHAWHEGTYYGWTHVLTDSNGVPLPEVAPNVYKIAVDTVSGLATVGVHMEAHTTKRVDNLFEIVGTATPLGFALGNATITGVAATRTLDLSKSTVVIQKLLNNAGKELVTSMTGPITLTRNAGSTKTSASYSSLGFPSITMQVNTVPFIGQVTTIQVFLADVQAPASCGLLFGTAPITTQFSIADGLGSPAIVKGTDTWTCVPGQILNF